MNKRIQKKKSNKQKLEQMEGLKKFNIMLRKQRAELIKANEELKEASADINLLVDSILIKTALKYGMDLGERVVLNLPDTPAGEVVKKYKLTSEHTEGNYRIAVEPIKSHL